MTQKKNDPGFSLRQCIDMTLFAMMCLYRPLRLFSTEFRTIGWREAGNWKETIYGMLALVMWASLSNSNALLVVGGGIAILGEILHRLMPGKGHSREFGVSALCKLTKNNVLAYRITGALAMLAGVGCWHLLDKGCGSYLVAAGISLVGIVQYLNARNKHMRQDLEDSIHYAETHGR